MARRTGLDGQAILDRLPRAGFSVPAVRRFGGGCLAEAGTVAASLVHTGPVLLVTGARSAGRLGLGPRMAGLLRGKGLEPAPPLRVAGEPDLRTIGEAVARARHVRPALVLAVGGGSVLDTGKAVAALAVNPGAVEDYLEGVGRRPGLASDPLPCIAVPTTAGTGSEMTRNAVVTCTHLGFKKSLRDPRLVPAAVLLDPALTLTLASPATAASGMDAVTQLIESCISSKSDGAVRALACRALRWTRTALPRCHRRPDDLEARSRMLMAASLSGVCLAHGGLAMAHGLAAALGALHGLPHGLACGILLPHTLRYNRDACEEPLAEAMAAFLNRRAPGPDTIDRGLAALDDLNLRLGLPPDLGHLLLTPAAVEKVARRATGNSMEGNPVPLNGKPEEIASFLLGLC